MRKSKLLLCGITIMFIISACGQVNENPSRAVSSLLDMVKVLGMGNITLQGSSEVISSLSGGCTGNSQDVELKLGEPGNDGLIGVELTVGLPYLWDEECNQIDGEKDYFGYGLFDLNTGMIVFDDCDGDKGEGTATMIAIEGKNKSEVGFNGEVKCFQEDKPFYELDFRVRVDMTK